MRIDNARFAEWSFYVDAPPFCGVTVYFLWGAIIKLNGTGTTFTVGDLETHRFGFSRGYDGPWEDGADVPALALGQRLYLDRVYSTPELPYEVSAETAVAIVRGIVEENLAPKTVYTLSIVASCQAGYSVRPLHLGRATDLQEVGLRGD